MTKTTFSESVTARLATLTTGNGYDAGKVSKLVKSIDGRGKTLDIDMHSCAVAALSLSDAHRDCNMMKLLLNGMPNGSRRDTLGAWFVAYGNVTVTKAKDKGYSVKMLSLDDSLPVDMVKATATPFWTAPEKVDAGAFNDAAACKLLEAFIKRARSDKSSLSPEMLEAVTQISVSLTAVTTPAPLVPVMVSL